MLKSKIVLIGLLAALLMFSVMFAHHAHAQIVATTPIVSGCNATGNITVCTMTDASTQRAWLIVYTSSGVSVVEDDLRK